MALAAYSGLLAHYNGIRTSGVVSGIGFSLMTASPGRRPAHGPFSKALATELALRIEKQKCRFGNNT